MLLYEQAQSLWAQVNGKLVLTENELPASYTYNHPDGEKLVNKQ